VERFIPAGAAALATLFLLAGCGQGPLDKGGGPAAATGQALEISPGVTVSSASYRIVGPNGFTSAGTVSVGNSADVPVMVAGVPIANGYELDLAATASDGTTVCEGSTSFDVTTSGPFTVVVHLTCGIPTGQIQVTGGTNTCPVLDLLEAVPAELRVGGRVTLHTGAHDSDNGPASISYKWFANGHVISGQTQPTLMFTCTSAGVVTITASVSDGDAACTDSLTAPLTCSP
jgi:hypothetical protein